MRLVPRLSRRGRRTTSLLAFLVLWLVAGVIPTWQYLDARHVPSGVTTTAATVTDIGSTRRRPGADRMRGRVATVDLAEGGATGEDGEGRVLLSWRWDYPEVGDTLQVWRDTSATGDDADALRSPAQASLVQLVFGLVMLVFWPVATLLWWRRSRRTGPGRAAR